jgi:uncharacterized protein (TIGR03435 family)
MTGHPSSHDLNSGRGMGFLTAPGGNLAVTNLTLQTLIQEVYGVNRYQIAGGSSGGTATGSMLRPRQWAIPTGRR